MVRRRVRRRVRRTGERVGRVSARPRATACALAVSPLAPSLMPVHRRSCRVEARPTCWRGDGGARLLTVTIWPGVFDRPIAAPVDLDQEPVHPGEAFDIARLAPDHDPLLHRAGGAKGAGRASTHRCGWARRCDGGSAAGLHLPRGEGWCYPPNKGGAGMVGWKPTLRLLSLWEHYWKGLGKWICQLRPICVEV